jgi:hypothetical protein
MPIDQKAIDQLKRIHFEEFGEKLTNEEAWDMGLRLVNLFKTLAKNPNPAGSEGPMDLTHNEVKRYD